MSARIFRTPPASALPRHRDPNTAVKKGPSAQSGASEQRGVSAQREPRAQREPGTPNHRVTDRPQRPVRRSQAIVGKATPRALPRLPSRARTVRHAQRHSRAVRISSPHARPQPDLRVTVSTRSPRAGRVGAPTGAVLAANRSAWIRVVAVPVARAAPAGHGAASASAGFCCSYSLSSW